MLIRKYVNNNVSNDCSVRPNDVVVDILITLWFQARVALYSNESKAEIFSLVFNAIESNESNWFSKDRLTHSPWIDLDTDPPFGFSIQGSLGRYFYIHKKHISCSQDFGWLVVTTVNCDWETRFPSRTVLYSNRTTNIQWDEYGT